jgi:hypothetical protein
MASNAVFPFNAWVWVKQPDYPWWPAVVLDPAQSGQDLPEGNDLVLLCGPTAAATLAFASSGNAEQVRLFRGAEADDALIQEGRKDDSCRDAIEEMIAATAAAYGSAEAVLESSNSNTAEPTQAAAPAPAAEADGDSVDWEAMVADTEAAMKASDEKPERHHHKKEKKHKKEKLKTSSVAKESNKDKKRSRRHHARDGETPSEEDEARGSSDDSDGSGEDDNNLFRRRNGTSSARRAAKKEKHERQSRLEEYDMGCGTLPHYAPRNDPDYLYRKLRNARRSATNEELMQGAMELRAVAGRSLSGAATPAEVEEDILRILRPLTSVDVTVAQLQQTGIGVAVGGFLRHFTEPVTQLAKAILNYWFNSLPQNTQEQLSAETEVDRASVDTCFSGSSSSEDGAGTLGKIGIMLYDSFTNEEIDDAPSNVKVVKMCKLLEEALTAHCSLDAQRLVLSEFGDDGTTGKSLRRLMLEGKINADDIVKHTDDLPALVRSNQRRPPNILTHTPNLTLSIGVGGGSPTSPNEVFSPNGEGTTGSPTFGSPTGRATTSLYTCPQCGANDAYQSSYTVQAHDNMPDILRCKKCGSTWNVSEQ